MSFTVIFSSRELQEISSFNSELKGVNPEIGSGYKQWSLGKYRSELTSPMSLDLLNISSTVCPS